MATEDVIPRQSDQGGTKLRAGAIGLAGATMQSIVHIAPAIAGLFFTQFVVSLTGVVVNVPGRPATGLARVNVRPSAEMLASVAFSSSGVQG